PSSTASSRSTTSLTCSRASPTTPPGALPNFSPGTGNQPTPPALPLKLAPSPSAYIGTQSADRIRASGHARRIEQAGHMSAPDRADLSERNPLRGGGRPHMTPLNRTRSGLRENVLAR